MHFKHRMAEFAYSLELWRSHMKKIEGHFGTGVTSYFLFLKWLFLLNIPVFTLTLGFVVVPQILYRYNIKVPSGYGFSVNETSVSFTGEELLTGGVSLIHWIYCTKFQVNGLAGWHKSWQKKQLKHTKLRMLTMIHILNKTCFYHFFRTGSTTQSCTTDFTRTRLLRFQWILQRATTWSMLTCSPVVVTTSSASLHWPSGKHK